MMLRLDLSARVGLILVIALFAGWLALIALVYGTRGENQESALPPPERVAALAALAERMSGEDRAQLLEAVGSSVLSARIEPPPGADPFPAAVPLAEALGAPYRTALGDRLLDMRVLRTARWITWLPLSPRVVEFRLRLRTGETLVIVTRHPFVVARFGWPVGLAAGLVGTVIALVALIALNREIRLLVRLAAAVDRVEPNGIPLPLPHLHSRAPEIRTLIAAFDRLQGRLATIIRARMALIGGIQHDVRSFATRLRLRVDHIPDEAERQRAATDISDMIALLDDALLASRAGARQLDEELIEFAPSVVAEASDRRAGGASIDLTVCPDALQATVLGDRLALRRVVANLIDNALAYGKAAHLTLTTTPKTIILTVDDEGPGIPVADRDLLLEPFVRLEQSRARGTGGAGLGLAIVRNLVEAHGGTVAIGDAPTGGARLTIRLPVFQPA